jgi:hypothetical protein
LPYTLRRCADLTIDEAVCAPLQIFGSILGAMVSMNALECSSIWSNAGI